ncbi:DUF4899 domain-containing protein [Fervidobacterium nodosum]|uniref:DUF4899 domain-containing protein n=1 Tax=Fervidobacterium nodosum (strain ATCC 35602 / DSM 5306 / Rt17-B1) TaxID=381764 RepID=A7HN64_FERNB|nr:DUF4899 domain-containing protein [Fervidobacterium nodosum]ABS61347.1 conserved hypothetical protein [Fervidobacterium nodosum Rt17-B1]
MDLYFIKVRAKSKGTAEDIVGYFFGKTNNAPDYDFVVVPLRYSNILEDITLEENLNEFKEKLENIKKKIKEIPGIYDITLAFLAYLNNMLNRRGKIPLGIEFSTAIKDDDVEVTKTILSDLLEEWSPKMEVSFKFHAMSLEEYSAFTFMNLQEDFSDGSVLEIYSRADVADCAEVFPVIDPINGTSIIQFDIGDKIPVVILNFGKYEKQIRELYPGIDKQKSSLEGIIISKELVRVKGGNLFLVKIEIGDGIIGKTLVSPALKILSDETYFLKKRKYNTQQQKESQKELPKHIKVEIPPTTGSELLISFMTTLLITGALLIIIYIFTK